LFLLALGATPSTSQSKYPALTGVITFEELQKQSFTGEVSWKNPDGTPERLTLKYMVIPVGEAMQQKIRKFTLDNYGLDSLWLNPKMIILHAMGDGDLKNSLEVSSFLNDVMPPSWGNLPRAGGLPNGAHFIIERDGTVICLTPPLTSDHRIAAGRENHRWFIKRHQDGNPVAIGIENITPQNDYTSLTEAQVNANAQLVRWLLWFEKKSIDCMASHHQFNEDEAYGKFSMAFGLTYLRMQYRTRGRKDIGDENLKKILDGVNKYGNVIKPFFD
jgi:N-acetylmuramoyl-L-alanine amidase